MFHHLVSILLLMFVLNKYFYFNKIIILAYCSFSWSNTPASLHVSSSSIHIPAYFRTYQVFPCLCSYLSSIATMTRFSFLLIFPSHDRIFLLAFMFHYLVFMSLLVFVLNKYCFFIKILSLVYCSCSWSNTPASLHVSSSSIHIPAYVRTYQVLLPHKDSHSCLLFLLMNIYSC
jgi:hypothetical protein